ncbi:MAG: helix-turn-helix transcriptional regulator [Cyanobacteria bacterium P01_D01_bin.56]
MASQTQLVPRMSAITTLEPPAIKQNITSSFNTQAALLIAAIDNFTVGLIIVAADGAILHQNKHAQTLLADLGALTSKVLPQQLWYCCQSLMEHQDEQVNLFPQGCTVVLEDEILTKHSTIHARVQWFDWDNSAYQSSDCFLITLENRQQSLTAMASQEAQRYGLTSRETDVWQLKRMGNSYKEISQALFISENTVKKHLKNIYAKKEQFGFQSQ